MTPGLLITPIFQGAKWEHTLTFRQSGTATPVNLTGLTPLVMEFRNSAGSLLASAAVTVATPSSGVAVVLLTAAQTNTFPLGTGTVNAGIRDALNNPYAQGALDVKPFTPDPA